MSEKEAADNSKQSDNEENTEKKTTTEAQSKKVVYQSRKAGGDSKYKSKGPASEGQKGAALEVSVDNNIEKAMKILKRKLIKEGLFKELKLRRFYEKPSERKKRKNKESIKKIRKEEARLKKNPYMY